jgi:nitroreductase
MDFFSIIEKRRSVRRFTAEAIAEDTVARILKAALSAPSSKNCRSSNFMVIDKPEVLERVSLMRDFGSALIKDAPLAILVMGDTALAADTWVENASISATYLQLAAEASGLGSCWVHVKGRTRITADPASEKSEDYLRSFLPIPEGHRILCAIAMGHPSK